MKAEPTYISKETYYTLIQRILRKHGGTLRMRYLDTLVKEHLEDRFGKQDLSYVETGFGSILRWKRVMSFAKVDLLKHGLVVQVKGMAVHMQYSKHLDLKRLAQKKINYHLLVQTMPPKIVKTIRGKALTYKVRV